MITIQRAFLFFVFICTSNLTPSAHAKKYTITDLQVPGEILWLAEGDLNGDEEMDLVFSYKRGAGVNSKKFLAIFFREDGEFSKFPQQAFQVPKRAVASLLLMLLAIRRTKLFIYARQESTLKSRFPNVSARRYRYSKHETLSDVRSEKTLFIGIL